MKWDDLLYEYESNLAFINRKRNSFSLEYLKGMYNMLGKMFHAMLFDCEDLPEIDYSTETFTYRGVEYKVYFDDYGQQMYLHPEGDRTLSGGSFNSNPEIQWISELNEIIDSQLYPWLFE